MAEEILFTQEGYDELVKKLDYLVSVRRAEVTEQMQVIFISTASAQLQVIIESTISSME